MDQTLSFPMTTQLSKHYVLKSPPLLQWLEMIPLSFLLFPCVFGSIYVLSIWFFWAIYIPVSYFFNYRGYILIYRCGTASPTSFITFRSEYLRQPNTQFWSAGFFMLLLLFCFVLVCFQNRCTQLTFKNQLLWLPKVTIT